jgi:hypothetical protein
MEASNNWSCLFDADKEVALSRKWEANLRTDFGTALALLAVCGLFWSSLGMTV